MTMAKKFDIKTFSLRFIAGASVAITCFYCTIEVAWPAVCRMQKSFNQRKAAAQKANLIQAGAAKIIPLTSSDKGCSNQKLVAYAHACKHISKSHIKLLEYLEFQPHTAFSKRDIYNLFAENVPKASRNMAVFVAWLGFLERANFIQVHAGRIGLTKVGLEFLQYTRQNKYFSPCSY